MSETKKRVLIIISSIIFILLYIIFAFKLPGEELQLIPKWTISVTKSSQNPEVGSNKFAFKLGQILGYFTEEGEIT